MLFELFEVDGGAYNRQIFDRSALGHARAAAVDPMRRHVRPALVFGTWLLALSVMGLLK